VRTKGEWARGFTLLEVLVAVAILGLGLTTILSAQFGAVRGVSYGRYLSVATGLARCKMSELEEHLRRDGFAETDEHDKGVCCEGDDGAVYGCDWSIEKPTFPEPEYGKLDLDADLGSGQLGALGKLAGGAASEGALPDGGLSGITKSLAGAGQGQIADAVAGGIGGVAALVMSMVYPDLRTMFEASTRRITVVVAWTEGSRREELVLTQWVTQPQAPVAAAAAELAAGQALEGLSGGGTTSGGASPGGASTGPTTTRAPGGTR
jgi:general secretion pathway protein I